MPPRSRSLVVVLHEKPDFESADSNGNRHSVLLSWAEATLFDRGNGSLGQSVTKAAHHSDVAGPARLADGQVENHRSLDSGAFGLFSVLADAPPLGERHGRDLIGGYGSHRALVAAASVLEPVLARSHWAVAVADPHRRSAAGLRGGRHRHSEDGAGRAGICGRWALGRRRLVLGKTGRG